MITAIIQARINSSRLFNKVFSLIEGKPLIYHIVERLKRSKKLDQIVLATSTNKLDDSIEKWCVSNGINFFRGDEENVLKRFYDAALKFNAKTIVRITADDPFKDPEIIDQVIELYLSNKLDFAYNNNPATFPEGLDVEVFSFKALEIAFQQSNTAFEKEHVTQYFYRNPTKFKQKNFSNYKDLSYLRWTIDQERDLQMVRNIFKYLYKENEIFYFNDIIELLNEQNWISDINLDVQRSEMYKKRQ